MDFKKLAMMACVAMSMAACSDDDEPEVTICPPAEESSFKYDANGAWTGVYTTDDVEFYGLTFSHEATNWGTADAPMWSWKGFIPSVSKHNADIAAGQNWTDYQWGAITGKGMSGQLYILACWDTAEDANTIPSAPSLKISRTDGSQLKPKEVYVTNSTWGYFGMKNGSNFNKAFTADDYCILHIIGVTGGKKSGELKFNLAKGTSLVNTWEKVDLQPLGEVDYIYFQMESSDNSTYGGVSYMNNPGYFAICNLSYYYLPDSGK